MKCPDDLELSIHADGELAPAEAAAVERHVEDCRRCAAAIADLRGENQALRDALETWPGGRSTFLGPAGLAAGLAALVSLGTLASLGWSLWSTSLPAWLNPLSAEGGINLAFNGGVLLGRIGGELMKQTETWSLAAAAASLAIMIFGSLGTLDRARRLARVGTRPLAFGLLVVLVLAAGSGPVAAVEFRSAATVKIDQSESLDETLFASGEIVRVDGRIDGDLIAAARQVTINGVVTGSVLAAAQNVDVNGEVGGTLGGFGQFVRVGASVDGNFYAAGQTVALLEGGVVNRDGFMAGEILETRGSFRRDLHAAGRKLTVSGRIERDLQVEAEELELAPSGHVGGSVEATLPSDDHLSMSAGATIAGDTEIRRAAPAARKSRFSDSGFYVWGLIKLAGAFIVGALLLWLAPGLFGHSFGSAGAGFGRAGIGFLVLLATPVALLIAAVTLVGLPLALLGALAFLAALYLSKIFVADWLGRRFTASDGSRPKVFLALLVGLVALTVAGALPWIGGWIKFAVLLLGLGMLSMRLFEAGRSASAQ
ncbi:MAG: zf-HC2 domain-containing protein [Thermoanaerobaculia bacterium]